MRIEKFQDSIKSSWKKGLVDCLAASSRPSDQQQRRPDGRTLSFGVVERTAGGCRAITDAADWRCLRWDCSTWQSTKYWGAFFCRCSDSVIRVNRRKYPVNRKNFNLSTTTETETGKFWKLKWNWNEKMKTVTENYESIMYNMYFSHYDDTRTHSVHKAHLSWPNAADCMSSNVVAES